jgi:hypothetical protein
MTKVPQFAPQSTFAMCPAAVTIDVVLAGWPAGQTVDDQEVLTDARRNTDDRLPGSFFWHRARDLRAIEQKFEQERAARAAGEGVQS